jgi:hypothetical protein
MWDSQGGRAQTLHRLVVNCESLIPLFAALVQTAPSRLAEGQNDKIGTA